MPMFTIAILHELERYRAGVLSSRKVVIFPRAGERTETELVRLHVQYAGTLFVCSRYFVVHIRSASRDLGFIP
ncbi:hypothetical protein RRSWK_02002 [Rhodopirellula sp. SWK7]|nr:hypothetical protein RRSWK_02002 [Rhodopirellula sp. SWK7]